MDSYKCPLYTPAVQDDNFFWRTGLGFNRLGEGDLRAVLTALMSTDPKLQAGLRL
jgi:hypothetical protein